MTRALISWATYVIDFDWRIIYTYLAGEWYTTAQLLCQLFAAHSHGCGFSRKRERWIFHALLNLSTWANISVTAVWQTRSSTMEIDICFLAQKVSFGASIYTKDQVNERLVGHGVIVLIAKIPMPSQCCFYIQTVEVYINRKTRSTPRRHSALYVWLDQCAYFCTNDKAMIFLVLSALFKTSFEPCHINRIMAWKKSIGRTKFDVLWDIYLSINRKIDGIMTLSICWDQSSDADCLLLYITILPDVFVITSFIHIV